jgi:hypothetical protein
MAKSFEKTSLISLAKEDLANNRKQKKHLMMENLEIIYSINFFIKQRK